MSQGFSDIVFTEGRTDFKHKQYIITTKTRNSGARQPRLIPALFYHFLTCVTLDHLSNSLFLICKIWPIMVDP